MRDRESLKERERESYWGAFSLPFPSVLSLSSQNCKVIEVKERGLQICEYLIFFFVNWGQTWTPLHFHAQLLTTLLHKQVLICLFTFHLHFRLSLPYQWDHTGNVPPPRMGRSRFY